MTNTNNNQADDKHHENSEGLLNQGLNGGDVWYWDTNISEDKDYNSWIPHGSDRVSDGMGMDWRQFSEAFKSSHDSKEGNSPADDKDESAEINTDNPKYAREMPRGLGVDADGIKLGADTSSNSKENQENEVSRDDKKSFGFKNFKKTSITMKNTNATYIGVFKGSFYEERYRVKDYKNLGEDIVRNIKQKHKNFNPSQYARLDKLEELGLSNHSLESVHQFGFNIDRVYANGNSSPAEIASEGLRKFVELEGIKEGDLVGFVNTYKHYGEGRGSNEYQLLKFDSKEEQLQAAKHYGRMDQIKLAIVHDYNNALKQSKKGDQSREYTPAFVSWKNNTPMVDIGKLNLISFQMMVLPADERNNVFSPSKEDFDTFSKMVEECASDPACQKNGNTLIATLLQNVKDCQLDSAIAGKLQDLQGDPAKDSLFAIFSQTQKEIGVFDRDRPSGTDKKYSKSTGFNNAEARRFDGDVNSKNEPAPIQSMQSLRGNLQQSGYTAGINAKQPIHTYINKSSGGFSFNMGLGRGFNPNNNGMSRTTGEESLKPKIHERIFDTVKGVGSVLAARINDVSLDDLKENIARKKEGLYASVNEAVDVGSVLLKAGLEQHLNSDLNSDLNRLDSTGSYSEKIQPLTEEQKQAFFAEMEKNGLKSVFEQGNYQQQPNFDNTDEQNIASVAQGSNLVDELDSQYLQDEAGKTADSINEINNDDGLNDEKKAQALSSEEEIAQEALRNRNKQDYGGLARKAIEKLTELQKVAQEALQVLMKALSKLFNKAKGGHEPPEPNP